MSSRRRRVALTGTAGVGKTQLALEYAYRHAHEFDLVWWLRAEEPTTLQEDYAALAEPLELPEAQESELAVVAYAVRRELSRREHWLLVFDNATGAEGGSAPAAGRQRPDSDHLAHTRAGPSLLSVDLPTLTRAASVTLLLARTGQDDREAADALAAELGDLPLALEQAAAYMNRDGNGSGPVSGRLFRARRAAA